MATTNLGHTKWSVQRDANGDREYDIEYKVKAAITDGPSTVLATAGLPQPGDSWNIGGDSDAWAFCTLYAQAVPVLDDVPNRIWLVRFKFSTKNVGGQDGRGGSCKTAQIDDPLLEPIRISGSFIRYTEEAAYDRFGRMLTNSSHEQLRGPRVEFDRNRPTVRIEQNVADLQLALIAQFMDCVNDAILWGLSPRCVKLSHVSWTRKFYGLCSVYYTRTLEFDINFETFDRDILDEGTKCLNGHWDENTGLWALDLINEEVPDPTNPNHFILFQDLAGNHCRVVLNGGGIPVGRIQGAPGNPFLAYSWSSNPVAIGGLPPIVDNGVSDDGRPTGLAIAAPAIEGSIVDSNKRYYFVVTAITPEGEGVGKSTERLRQGLMQWVSIRVSPDSGSGLMLNWYAVEGATSYNIYGFSNGDFHDEPINGSNRNLYSLVATVTPETEEYPGNIHIEKYPQVNLLLLGIPTTF